MAASVSAVDVSSPAWTSTSLDGELYGEPLVSSGRVFVATENDTIYALSATTGTVLWSTHLGTPVPSGSLPCGDISPTVGITGTPVVDQTRAELFVVADELVNGRPAHQLVGLSTTTGKTELNQNVDPAGSSTAALLQRTGLTLDAGHVVFGYGGNFGDCSTYHGWVMSVPEGGGTPDAFEVDSATGDSQGAVWMGGAAPVVDSDGNIWVTAGNGSVTSSSHAYDDSDSVLELSPSLTLKQYFAPSSWPSDNAHDLDFSTSVALLSDGQVVAASKSRTVFLLNGSSLGGIGGQQAQLADACDTVIDGGLAVEGSTVYLPCQSGPVAVQASDSPAGIRLLWSSSDGGGPPIVAGGLVWTIGSNGTLYGLNPSSGATPGASDHRRAGQPLPHSFRRCRSAAGTRCEPGRGLRDGISCSKRRDHDHRELDDDIHDGGPRATERDRSLGRCGRHRRWARRPRPSDLAPVAARPCQSFPVNSTNWAPGSSSPRRWTW